MLVSIILNLNMTGSGPTPPSPVVQEVDGVRRTRQQDKEKQKRDKILHDDREILLFVETILRECQ